MRPGRFDAAVWAHAPDAQPRARLLGAVDAQNSSELKLERDKAQKTRTPQ